MYPLWSHSKTSSSYVRNSKHKAYQWGAYPKKTRILTSTSGTSPIPMLLQVNPLLADNVTRAITRYSTKVNKLDPQNPTLVELLTGF